MSRISSKKYLAGSRGQECTFRIPGICDRNTETVVPCHIRDRHTGGATKASDISIANGCFSCHALMDGRSGTLSDVDWLYYALRGLQETLEQRFEAGLLIVPVDAEKPMERAVKPRKPKEQRTKIPSRPMRRKDV